MSVRRISLGLVGIAVLAATTSAQQMPQTTTEKMPGAPTVTTEKMSGEVVKVEGNTLVVRMSNGELRTFSNVPESRKAMIDGNEVGLRDLQPGTRLTATITKTSTPVTVRTTTVGTGKVWFVSGPNVILTLPNGENKQYKVKPDYKFVVNGNPATVYDLRPGMTVSAEKIVEEPSVDIAMETKVTGHAPGAGLAASATEATTTAGTSATAAGEAPATLPKTGSPVPLVGLLGLLFVGASFALRKLRRQ
jgi:LPXTG-motif cell wall-anchored protein